MGLERGPGRGGIAQRDNPASRNRPGLSGQRPGEWAKGSWAPARSPRARPDPVGCWAGQRKQNSAHALELLSRRGLEHPCETLVAWAREA